MRTRASPLSLLSLSGLVHWFTKPYILSLAASVGDVADAASAAAAGTSTTATATVTRLDFFGRRNTSLLSLASVVPPAHTIHPPVTFSDGEGKLFYIDVDNWPKRNEAGGESAAAARLLALLTPKEEEVPGAEVPPPPQRKKSGKKAGRDGGAAAA